MCLGVYDIIQNFRSMNGAYFFSPAEGVCAPVDIVGFVSHHDRSFFRGPEAVPHVQALCQPATKGKRRK